MSAHMHVLVSWGRLLAFNQHGHIKSHQAQPLRSLLPFSLLEIDLA